MLDFDKYKLNRPTNGDPVDVGRYRQGRLDMKDVFEKDVIDALGLTDHPKAELLFEISWEYGHSAGYHEVYSYAQDMAPLLK